jgi:tRNA A58 N-methylase Trm61
MTRLRPLHPAIALLAIVALMAVGCGRSDDAAIPGAGPRVPGQPDVAFIVTPDRVVDAMLEAAEIRPDDVVYDLGCGDGRIVIAAAKKHGVRAVGIEIDPQVVEKAKENVRTSGVENLVTIRQGDIFEADFREATVVTMYLLPDLNVRLMPKLKELKPGSRIVSHSFPMKGAKPEKVLTVVGKKVYLWRVPWDEE